MKKKKKKKYVCDCGVRSPHGGEDCAYYKRIADAIVDTVREVKERMARQAESDIWEKIRF